MRRQPVTQTAPPLPCWSWIERGAPLPGVVDLRQALDQLRSTGALEDGLLPDELEWAQPCPDCSGLGTRKFDPCECERRGFVSTSGHPATLSMLRALVSRQQQFQRALGIAREVAAARSGGTTTRVVLRPVPVSGYYVTPVFELESALGDKARKAIDEAAGKKRKETGVREDQLDAVTFRDRWIAWLALAEVAKATPKLVASEDVERLEQLLEVISCGMAIDDVTESTLTLALPAPEISWKRIPRPQF